MKRKKNINEKDNNNLLYIKNKVKQSLDYLDIIEKFLEEKVFNFIIIFFYIFFYLI